VRRPRKTLDLRRPLSAAAELAEIPGFSGSLAHPRGRLINKTHPKGTLGGKWDRDPDYGQQTGKNKMGQH
jgi:hypothetical protein